MVHTYNELIKKSIILRQTFFDTWNQVIRDYPNINSKKDARVTFFTKSFAVLDSVTLCSIFGDSYLIKNRWWTTITRKYSLMSICPYWLFPFYFFFDGEFLKINYKKIRPHTI
jgi:hypothetical protein